MADQKSAELIIEGKSYALPIVEGSEGEKAVDIGSLRSDSGYITLDPGYVNTGACQSAITFLNGEKGILRHRGYALEDLAEKASFLGVAYLLIYGTYPTSDELEAFTQKVKEHYPLQEEIVAVIDAFPPPPSGHPMAILSSSLMMMSSLSDWISVSGEEDVNESITCIMAKIIAVAAYSYRRAIGKDYIEPSQDLDYVENFLNMMMGDMGHSDELMQMKAEVINKLLIIHADHEQNCSTSTVRLVSSSGANAYAAVAGGLAALWGPLHGGANEAVMKMLEDIHAEGGDIEDTLRRAKDKDDPFRLMGFGHRVYKTYDPRAKIAKQGCKDLLKLLDMKEPLIEIALRLEDAGLNDEYFKSRNLYPNVDFYTGIIYRALGLPNELFTVLFAIGRMPGWIANLVELQKDPEKRIGRPRQIYTGPELRPFEP